MKEGLQTFGVSSPNDNQCVWSPGQQPDHRSADGLQPADKELNRESAKVCPDTKYYDRVPASRHLVELIGNIMQLNGWDSGRS